MRPVTRAGYAAVVLAVLAVLLNGARVALLLNGDTSDPALTLAANSSLTAAVAALVWLVHTNGAAR